MLICMKVSGVYLLVILVIVFVLGFYVVFIGVNVALLNEKANKLSYFVSIYIECHYISDGKVTCPN